MSTFAWVIGLAAAVCTTAANLPQLKKAWTTGQTDDISLKTLLLFACGLALWVEFTWMPPLWVHALLWLPLICLLTAIFLRLSKSALLVLQYKHKAGEGRIE